MARESDTSLREAEQLIAVVRAFIGFLAPTGEVLALNDLALAVIEARREDIVGQRFWEAPWWRTVPESAARIRAAIEDAARGVPAQFDVEYWAIVDGVGGRRWVAVTMRPMAEADVVTRVAVSGVDITERVRVSDALRASEQQAAEVGARLRELFMQAPIPISVLRGIELRYELANAPYHEMVAKSELVGRTLGEAFPEVIGTPLYDVFERVVRTGEPFTTDEYKTALVRHGVLEDCYFKFNLVATRELGRITGLMCTAVEITEQVRARLALQEALEVGRAAQAEAERANRAKDEFLAILGHELRNPLTPILTAVELMEERAVESPEQRAEREAQARVVIERQVNHMVRLVDDLLDVSRITSGKIELKSQRVEIAAVVAHAVELASPLIEARAQDLVVDVAPTGLALDGDPARLAQVFSNLLTNAAKYSERGGRITVAAARTGDELVVRVHDLGIGIEPEMLPLVFDAFVQERQALDRTSGGLGLGLAIVKSLVALHGGRVEAHSAGRGHGTEIVVRLPAPAPAARPKTPPTGTERAPSAPGAPSADSRTRRILVVDDNEDAAEMLAAYLQIHGHTTHVAHDGPAALRQVTAFAPDIALLDIGLPVMDGYELARQLRADASLAPLVLVAITGYGQDSDRARSREAGFDAHLVKPVSPSRLAQLIDELFTSPRAS